MSNCHRQVPWDMVVVQQEPSRECDACHKQYSPSRNSVARCFAQYPLMTMEAPLHTRNNRLRGFETYDGPAGRRPNSRNKQWVAGEGGRSETNTPAPPHADGERRGRGTWRGGRGGRGLPRGSPRKFPNHSLKVDHGATRHSFSADEEESHDTEEGSSHGLEEEQPSYDAEEGESHVVNDEEVVPPDGKERVEFKDKVRLPFSNHRLAADESI